jgi:hypothetical protein
MNSFHPNLHLEIVQGDDYLGDSRLSITGLGVLWPTAFILPRFVVYSDGVEFCKGPVLDVDCDLTTVDGLPVVRIPISRARSIGLTAGVRAYGFELRGLVDTNKVRTLARGRVTVLRGVV